MRKISLIVLVIMALGLVGCQETEKGWETSKEGVSQEKSQDNTWRNLWLFSMLMNRNQAPAPAVTSGISSSYHRGVKPPQKLDSETKPITNKPSTYYQGVKPAPKVNKVTRPVVRNRHIKVRPIRVRPRLRRF